ncbi:efflux RND transporter periplasmic adaptor subunit [Paucibacter soli]|uniref:efflux RND transporter periplasmic adaptor subunit n=1 Tax=Paucibacter soli TaxID=3133433 RepID=UPI0030B226C4
MTYLSTLQGPLRAAAVALLSAGLAALVQGSAAAAPAAAGTPVTPVTATIVQQQQSWPDQIQAQGVIAAWQEAVVASPSSGLALLALHAAVGERVRRGALLARFDDRALRAELQRAEAELARATATRQQADAEAARAQALHAGGSVSEQELQALQTQLALARAQQQAAAAGVQALRIRLDDTRVLAPDDGLITARAALLGQVPAAGTELFRLIRQHRLEWRAELNPEQLARVRPGMAVRLQLPDGQQAQGKVRQLAGALEASNRLALVYVDLQPGSSAKASMLAAGQFELPGRPALVLPAEALLLRDGRALVFVLEGESAHARPVQTGRRQGGEVEIVAGLRAGERVVLQGAGFLRDGERVRALAAKPAAEPTAKGQP